MEQINVCKWARRLSVVTLGVCLIVALGVSPTSATTYFTQGFSTSVPEAFLEGLTTEDTTHHVPPSYPSNRIIGADGDTTALGSYAGSEFNVWSNHYSNIKPDGSVLEVEYDAGYLYGAMMNYYLRRAETEQGAFYALDAYRSYEEKDEMYLSYRVKFDADFNEDAEPDAGKLPGLGATRTHGAALRKPNGLNGWSARVIWKQEEGDTPADSSSVALIGYLYHKNQPSSEGHNIPKFDAYAPRISKGEWYTVKIHVDMNATNDDDGTFRMWIDNTLRVESYGDSVKAYGADATLDTAYSLGNNTLEYSNTSSVQINRVWAGMYYGGSGYTVRNTSSIYIDDLVASSTSSKPLALVAAPVPMASGLLEQNAPNPFNPSTTIRYSLRTPGSVVLRVFDAVGQEVRRLVRVEQLPGSYDVTWDGRDNVGRHVSSGVYFSQLTIDGVSQTKKMVLAR